MIQEMEILHLRFLKHILCVHKNTCNDIVYGETGTYPLNIDIKVKVLCYWIRPITGRREKLANVSYQCLFHLDAAHLYTSPWLKEVKCTLDNWFVGCVVTAGSVQSSVVKKDYRAKT